MEKLCQRFRLSTEPRQWRDIAYCLSLLPFKSERSVKKLIEGLPFYQDKLHEEPVFNRFNEILTKVMCFLVGWHCLFFLLTQEMSFEGAGEQIVEQT